MVSNEFVEAKRILDNVRQMEDRERREYLKKCDWYDPTDVAEYRRSIAIEERERIVMHLCPDYLCPICRKLYPSIRAWIINKGKDLAVCRGCYVRSQRTLKEGEVQLDFSVFSEIKRYTVDWKALSEARSASGISRREFARLAGWTPVYQAKLENGDYGTISSDTRDIIIEVLRRLKIIVDDMDDNE